MKAIVVSAFGNEEVLQYRDVQMPVPGAGQVRVRLQAAGVNPVDTYIRAGQYGKLPPLPYIPGSDGAGVIDAVGAGVKGFSAGERVFVAAVLAKHNSGTYAEYVVCDAEAVCKLPDALTCTQGAGLGTPGLAATDALFCRAKLRSGERVLIHGASGGVGTLAVQLAHRHGAAVFGTAGNEAGLALVKKLGAEKAFNHRQEGYVDEILDATNGHGADVIIEMAAGANLAKDMTLIAKYGRVVVVGSRGTLPFDPRGTMNKNCAILGMGVANVPHADYVANMHTLAAAIENGMQPVVDHVLPLKEAAQAHRDVSGASKNGKIILTIDG